MVNEDGRVDRREFLNISAVAGLAAVAGSVASTASAQSLPNPGVLEQPVGAPLRVRRVVTGHHDDGRSYVEIDDISEYVSSRREGQQGAVIWSTGESPADNLDPSDGGARTLATSDDNGTVFRIVKYDPGVAPRNHRTQSLDYAVVMSGEITMGLDDGEVTLRQGDVLVQRGTLHDWVNNGDVPCVVAFILCAARPLELEGVTFEPTG